MPRLEMSDLVLPGPGRFTGAGLLPLRLLRPLAVTAACLGALLNGGGWPPALLVGTTAGAAVLCVEPAVHRRW
ncbi:hypothetical protein [Streptomyces bambusae]|uniref:FUSC family protein n=1 Tax=Streptomyces bambusae TaxID=1550616 RepID=A0ABS6Z0E0_9ACTN|nr:hypothetical protein [Streptomyces bambusae]MBW5481210.1 hypothetical protein [Streptomyces bambusae]